MLKTWRIKQNMVFHSLKLSLRSLTQIELSPVTWDTVMRKIGFIVSVASAKESPQ